MPEENGWWSIMDWSQTISSTILYSVLLLLQGQFNKNTLKFEKKEGVKITVRDFGGDESVQYDDSCILGFQIFDTYASLLHYQNFYIE